MDLLAECIAYWIWSRPKLAHATLGKESEPHKDVGRMVCLGICDVEGESNES